MFHGLEGDYDAVVHLHQGPISSIQSFVALKLPKQDLVSEEIR
jgi:hypothetical protein